MHERPWKPRWIPLALGLCLLGWGVSRPRAEGAGNPCRTCHEDQVKAYSGTIHEKAMLAEPLRNGCETCHGSGKAHMDDPSPDNIRGKKVLGAWTSVKQTDACLTCHGSVYRDKRGARHSVHAKAGVSCWDCHAEMLHFKAGEGPKVRQTALAAPFMANNPNERCLKCHEDQRVEFALPYRHPVDRGQIRCWDCHNPHGEDAVTSTDEAAATAVCTKCHAAQQGPFVWRHLALDDGCAACHVPHGSVNPDLLAEAGTALCLKCHFETSFPQVGAVNHRFKLDRHARCLDCHTAAHGSNVSETLLR